MASKRHLGVSHDPSRLAAPDRAKKMAVDEITRARAELRAAAKRDPRFQVRFSPILSPTQPPRHAATIDGFDNFMRVTHDTWRAMQYAAIVGQGRSRAAASRDLMGKLAAPEVMRVVEAIRPHFQGEPVLLRIFAAAADNARHHGEIAITHRASDGVAVGEKIDRIERIGSAIDTLLDLDLRDDLRELIGRLVEPDGCNTTWDSSIARWQLRTRNGVRKRWIGGHDMIEHLMDLRAEVRSDLRSIIETHARQHEPGQKRDPRIIHTRKWQEQTRLLTLLWNAVFLQEDARIPARPLRPAHLPSHRAIAAAANALGMPVSPSTVQRIFQEWM